MVIGLNLSNVKNFEGFLKKIKMNLSLDSSNHTLKIYCLNSELTKEEFFEVLETEYPFTEFIDDFAHTYLEKSGEEKKEINFYSYKDPENSAIFVLSIVGKGEIDVVLDSLIKKLEKTYYFWLPLSIFDQVKEEVIDHFNDEGAKITSFTSVRTLYSENKCNLRPNADRRMEYEGEDGLETIRELRSMYGVLPKKIGFQIGKKIKFSIDQRNTLIINHGLPYLDQVLEVIKITLNKFSHIGEVLKNIKFKEVSVDGNIDFEIIPLTVSFSHKKSSLEIERFFDLIEKNEEGKYCVLNPLTIEGSLFFSATILDVNKRALFSISGNEEVMNILPQSNCGKEVISRFYEGVDLNLDNHTKITSENA